MAAEIVVVIHRLFTMDGELCQSFDVSRILKYIPKGSILAFLSRRVQTYLPFRSLFDAVVSILKDEVKAVEIEL